MQPVRTLRITQTRQSSGGSHVEIALEGDDLARQVAVTSLDLELTTQDHDDLRWYLEEYLLYPQAPAPTIAKRVEDRMAEFGRQLFKGVFHSTDDGRDLWAQLRSKLNETRVEIVTPVAEGAFPWELIRDPKTDTPLALHAASFVRSHPQAAQRPELPQPRAQLRVLLVICRPAGDEDVPFRSVAMPMIKALDSASADILHLDVLRPPTFAELSRVLRQAKADGRPYHLVHFDGHGIFAEPDGPGDVQRPRQAVVPSGPRAGQHGFLLFENPQYDSNIEPVDGPTLGKLLVEAGVPVLVLNACRSAFAELLTSPVEASETSPEATDPHSRVRAFGSLAQEVMDAGLAGVVAMRYNVYVITAAQFVADLYASLVRGQSLGEAVTMGRKQLAASPQRSIAFDPRRLQDWCVPVVYEAAPLKLFPDREPGQLKIEIHAGEAASGGDVLDPLLPRAPDLGFFGRDETLFALDRLFDAHHVALLHGYAGSGKTSASAEFGRWYWQTGAVEQLLFTSFERYAPLSRVLDRVGERFAARLEESGIDWLTIDDRKRRDVALQILHQVPVLWIWDNVEPIAGFPAGNESQWSGDEQQELVDFLRDASQSKAKFLLTSRREERRWLGDLAGRVAVPPMPMLERLQLTRVIVERHGKRLTDIDDWRPLLRFTAGNPLTITVVVRQALQDGVKTKEQIEAFVAELRAGEAEFREEVGEGRSSSLAASLAYGFHHAFSKEERKQLAALHLFQDIIDVQFICEMGNPTAEYCLPEFATITPSAARQLLERATEVGLLSRFNDLGVYSIHPAVPWFFRQMALSYGDDAIMRFRRAYVGVMALCAQSMWTWIDKGNPDALPTLRAMEANLLNAHEVALQHEWWDEIKGSMYGLKVCYEYEGRWAELSHLAGELFLHVAVPETGLPLPNRQREWQAVTEIQARIEFEGQNFERALQLYKMLVENAETSAKEALARTESEWTLDDRDALRTLVAYLLELGNSQSAIPEKDSLPTFQRAISLVQRLEETGLECDVLHSLGVAHLTNVSRISLDEAEKSFQRILDIAPETDDMRRGAALYESGLIQSLRFVQLAGDRKFSEAQEAADQSKHLFEVALSLTPADNARSLATRHFGLGNLYVILGGIDGAILHLRESIRWAERAEDTLVAGKGRIMMANALRQDRRDLDALEYAQSAKQNFASVGGSASSLISDADQLIRQIEGELGFS